MGMCMTHAEEAPYSDDVSVAPGQVMMEPETFGVKELQEIACVKVIL